LALLTGEVEPIMSCAKAWSQSEVAGMVAELLTLYDAGQKPFNINPAARRHDEMRPCHCGRRLQDGHVLEMVVHQDGCSAWMLSPA
jgi:hypothetical protein